MEKIKKKKSVANEVHLASMENTNTLDLVENSFINLRSGKRVLKRKKNEDVWLMEKKKSVTNEILILSIYLMISTSPFSQNCLLNLSSDLNPFVNHGLSCMKILCS